MNVSAVVEPAFFRKLEYLLEKMSDFVCIHVYSAESFNARSIDYRSAMGQVKHFRESGGVHAFVMVFGNFSHADFSMRNELIDDG